jgi:hypothetical protein
MAKELTRKEMAMAGSAGYSVSELLSAGYSLSALRRAGYSASELLSADYSLSALRRAGYSAAELRRAGYSVSELLSAGYSLSALRRAGFDGVDEILVNVPLIERPYTRMLADIRNGQRKHDQSIFGPENEAENTACKTAMCTAGHLVSMAGRLGWDLKVKYGWVGAATLIHARAHPEHPCQKFGAIPQAWALAYIEEMAEIEAKPKDTP